MRWLGLRARIALAIIAVAVGACAALTAGTSTWALAEHERHLEQSMESSVQMDLEAVSDVLERNPAATADDFVFGRIPAAGYLGAEGLLIPLDSPSGDVDPSRARTYFDAGWIDLTGADGRCRKPQANAWRNEIQAGEVVTWTERCSRYLMGYGEVVRRSNGVDHAWMLVQAQVADTGTDPLWELREVQTGYSVCIVACAAIIAVVLALMASYPLIRARDMAEAVAAGDLGKRLPVRGRDPVARMSAAVNTMADGLTAKIGELERANEAQRGFVSDVAHELRTPTAALLASAEALEHPETRDEAAALVAPQLRRLATLTEDLLEISRMDAGRAVVVPARIDVADLVAEVVADCGSTAGVGVVGALPHDVVTDPARLRVILRNLVANGLQHGAPPVTITGELRPWAVEFSVSDAGSGVPVELRERVFDRFVRGDAARHGPSTGLGLAIAAENARLLGGSLSLSPDGRTFVLTIPVGASG
jgi:signal transduction histidine kinase